MGSITIKLRSDLCVGNGESVGYGIDNDICTDSFGFPYIPGKRILGCMREAAMQLRSFGYKAATDKNIEAIFGDANGSEGKLILGNAYLPEIDSMHHYIRELAAKSNKMNASGKIGQKSSPKWEDDVIEHLLRQSTKEKLIRLYTSVRGQTKINNDGRAAGGSLRFIRVLNQYDPMNKKPLEFISFADTTALEDEQIRLVEDACKALRHIGLNRNRGLGNIEVTLNPDNEAEKGANGDAMKKNPEDGCRFGKESCLRYQVTFDSPIALQEYSKSNMQIPARTLIGVFAERYQRKFEKADENFKRLFLDGTVRWSALTPLINGHFSVPAPAMIMKLKNGGGKLINSFFCNETDWKKMKPKSTDRAFMSMDEGNIAYICEPETESDFHNRINGVNTEDGEKKGLYMQEALRRRMTYGGYVVFPKELTESVKELLSVSKIRLGRSKKTQYGMASVHDVGISDYSIEDIEVEDNETVFAVLRSDLVCMENARFQVTPAFVRGEIVKNTGLKNVNPDEEEFRDICGYRVLTGYHAMWQMQKPKIPAVRGGSIYCFKGKKGRYPSKIVLGEYQNEGMGIIELIPMHILKNMTVIRKGRISSKAFPSATEHNQELENMFLMEAALEKLREYAFSFKTKFEKKNRKENVKYGKNSEKELKLENIPVGRLRQMLQDAKDIKSLWQMVENMKTSDVSSESQGKRDASIRLLKEFYGENNTEIDWKKIMSDDAFYRALSKNEKVFEQVRKRWKEPLLTLLHMLHYQKGRRHAR